MLSLPKSLLIIYLRIDLFNAYLFVGVGDEKEDSDFRLGYGLVVPFPPPCSGKVIFVIWLPELEGLFADFDRVVSVLWGF